jgi:hypothetical protein
LIEIFIFVAGGFLVLYSGYFCMAGSSSARGQPESATIFTFAGVRRRQGYVNGVRMYLPTSPAAGAAFSTGPAYIANANSVAAQFNQPYGMAIDSSLGYPIVFLADGATYVIRTINVRTNQVWTFAGNTRGWPDGIGSNAGFYQIYHLESDRRGLVQGRPVFFIGDYSRIRRMIVANQSVATIAGSNTAGFADGFGSAAMFNLPCESAMDPFGQPHLYIADYYNNRIRMLNLDTRQVITVAGGGSLVDGPGPVATFVYPYGLEFGPPDSAYARYLFITDAHRVRMMDIDTRFVYTIAGKTAAGFADGIGSSASFSWPRGIVPVALSGTVYAFVASSNDHRVRRVNVATGEVVTVAGTGVANLIEGVASSAAMEFPTGLEFYSQNLNAGTLSLLVSEAGANSVIREFKFSAASVCQAGYVCGPGSVNSTGTSLCPAGRPNNKYRQRVLHFSHSSFSFLCELQAHIVQVVQMPHCCVHPVRGALPAVGQSAVVSFVRLVVGVQLARRLPLATDLAMLVTSAQQDHQILLVVACFCTRNFSIPQMRFPTSMVHLAMVGNRLLALLAITTLSVSARMMFALAASSTLAPSCRALFGSPIKLPFNSSLARMMASWLY